MDRKAAGWPTHVGARRDGAPFRRWFGCWVRSSVGCRGRLEATLAAEKLTVDQWRVLDLLSDGPGRTMSQIMAATGVPGPTLTKIVDKLIDATAVYRLVDPRDRRRVLAFISDEGRILHERLSPEITSAEADALVVLGDDAPQLIELLSRLTDNR